MGLTEMAGRLTSSMLAAASWRRYSLRRPIISTGLLPFSKVRGRLFAKYVALFVTVVCVALTTNAILEFWFFYREHQATLVRIQKEQAEAASAKIGQFIEQIETQLGWATQLPWHA